MKNKLTMVLAGACYALSFPFYGKLNLLPLVLISGIFYFKQFLSDKYSLKKVIINTLIFCWAYNLIGYYWLTFTLQEFGGLFFPFNALLWQGFSLIIAPQFYIFAIVFYFINKYRSGYISSPYFSTSLAFLWVIIEYFTPQQFPAHFGHPWLQIAPYLKLAHYFGAPIYGFITILLSLSVAKFHKYRRIEKLDFTIAITLIALNFALGKIEEPKTSKTINTRFVQANIGNDLKLKSEGGIQLARNEVIDIFRELSHQDSYIGDIDLTIWPETAYPKYLMTKRSTKVPSDLEEIIRAKGGKYFVGTYDLAHFRQTSYEQAYNTAILIDQNSKITQTYHKRVLIPFGEGLPFGSLNERIAPLVENISFFAKGENFTFFKLTNDSSFISLICYEILFPEYLRDYLNSSNTRPSFMINLTNDSWYGPYAEQEQHLFLAKWRSVEFNLPMLRSTNTGISSYILGNGLEVKRLGNFEQGNLDVKVSLSKTEATTYQKYGMIPLALLFLIMTLIRFIYLKNPLSKDHAS